MRKRRTTQGHIDPVTGDELTRLEYLTRQVQVVVRSPWFMMLFNIITIAAILFHGLDYWNYFASWLAVQIEWVVGTYMFGQTGRDAVVLRKNARLEEQNASLLERIEKMEERILLAVTSPAVHYSESEESVEGQTLTVREEMQHGAAGDSLPTGEHSEAE